jgi:hypothetical protein
MAAKAEPKNGIHRRRSHIGRNARPSRNTFLDQLEKSYQLIQ